MASPGFLADLWTVWAEIAQFAIGMAANDLLENIRCIAGGHGNVVTSAQEAIAELGTLGAQGYTLVLGGGSSRTDADLIEAFAQGTRGKLL